MRFDIAVPDAELDDLRLRLGRTRWADDLNNADWRYGVERHSRSREIRFQQAGWYRGSALGIVGDRHLEAIEFGAQYDLARQAAVTGSGALHQVEHAFLNRVRATDPIDPVCIDIHMARGAGTATAAIGQNSGYPGLARDLHEGSARIDIIQLPHGAVRLRQGNLERAHEGFPPLAIWP